MKKLVFGLLIVMLLLSACRGGAATGTPQPTTAPEATATPTTAVPTEEPSWQETVPLIPREVLFGNPDKSSVALSPDGTRISYRAPVDGVMNVWVGPADDLAAAEPVTHDTDRGITFYGWAYTNEHILYLQDQAGEENWRMYSVNLNTGETIDLTPLEGVQARAQAFSPDFPQEFIVCLSFTTFTAST